MGAFRTRAFLVPLLAASFAAILSGCYALRGSSGGGKADFTPPRIVRAEDVALPPGYRIEPVATGLTFPTGIAFADDGAPFVVESGYAYGEVWTEARLLRIDAAGNPTVIARGGKNGPWTGVTFHKGAFYVAEGGTLEGGRILRIAPDGKIEPLVRDLPSRGDHHTNGPVAGPDGMLYFGQGTATNSGVVGEDNAKFGWLARNPEFHDVACRDIALAGENHESNDPRRGKDGKTKVATGAYVPFGTPTQAGQVVRGRVPCSGAILRVRPEGGEPELVAWGFRNPFGLAFGPDGRLYVTNNEYDDRGSRPVFGTGDTMWRVTEGEWYGWPDYHAGRRLDADLFVPPGKERPRILLARPPGQPPKPVAIFGVHASADGFDFSRSPEFGHAGEAFVALFGDETPNTGKVLGPVGFKVVRVDVETGVLEDFAVNRGKTNGPASRVGGGGLERPVAVRFDREGRALYVVDFGVMLENRKGSMPLPGTGVLWKITRSPAGDAR